MRIRIRFSLFEFRWLPSGIPNPREPSGLPGVGVLRFQSKPQDTHLSELMRRSLSLELIYFAAAGAGRSAKVSAQNIKAIVQLAAAADDDQSSPVSRGF